MADWHVGLSPHVTLKRGVALVGDSRTRHTQPRNLCQRRTSGAGGSPRTSERERERGPAETGRERWGTGKCTCYI